jgi:hypothetical protein
VVAQPSAWLPSLRHPDDLFLAYSGRSDELSSASAENARTDLVALNVMAGLSKNAFMRSIGVLLIQQPIVQHIDRFLINPQRFGAVRDELAGLPCAASPDFEPTLAWQTIDALALLLSAHALHPAALAPLRSGGAGGVRYGADQS